MKAYFTNQDELVIEAESIVEAMAMRYWSDDYFKRKPKRASLLLQFSRMETGVCLDENG